MFNSYFGLPVDDMSNSILTAGLIDFGVWGVFVYPVLVCVAFHFAYYLIGHVLNEEGRIAVFIPMISLMLITEMEVNGYVIYLRSIVIISFIWMMLYEMPDFFSIARSIYRSDEKGDVGMNVSAACI